MIYNLEITSDNSERTYTLCSFDSKRMFDRPVHTLEIGIGDEIINKLRYHLSKISGYEYMNSLISPGSVGVEIGVDHGDGAARLLETDLARLHMVDPWVATENRDSWTDVDQGEMDRRHQLVCDRFDSDPRVRIHRDTSDTFFSDMPEAFADWVYIDGCHEEHQVYADLCNSLRAVRPGGYIFGDDLWDSTWHHDIDRALYRFLIENEDRVELIWGKTDPFVIGVRNG